MMVSVYKYIGLHTPLNRLRDLPGQFTNCMYNGGGFLGTIHDLDA